ncbi:MAG: DUF2156 domain-containing protein [Planctomycetaceae bacterium]
MNSSSSVRNSDRTIGSECVDGPLNRATDVQTGESTQTWSASDGVLHQSSEMSAEQRRRFERMAFEFGQAAESYNVVMSPGTILKTPCGQGLVSVLKSGRSWHLPGGLLAPDELQPAFVDWLKRISARQRRTIAVYSVSQHQAEIFRESGFEVTKLGEVPVLDLGGITWKGREFEWVRRQTNFCLRAGVSVNEITDAAEQQRLAPELIDILNADLSTRTYSRPLSLLEGEFCPRSLGRQRLFLARTLDRIEGFLVCSPMRGGEAWAFEVYRKRSDAVRGTIPFLFRTVTDRLQEEGRKQVSLCLVPGRGMHVPSAEGGHRLVRFSLDLLYRRVNFLFNTQGQDYFKSRFRPRYVDRYVCVTPNSSILSICSFLHVTGAFRPNPINLVRNLARDIFSGKGRAAGE